MPRFVRPAWITLEGRGTGPRSRDGWLSGRVTLRTPAGTVSDGIAVQAGGMADDGAGVLILDIPAGFVGSAVVTVPTHPGATRPAERRVHLAGPCLVTIRPAREEA